MARTTIRTSVPPEAVFAVLADPHRYPEWVVGARRIDEVEGEWPRPGSRFTNQVGPPLMTTRGGARVVACTPPTSLVLDVVAPPVGRGRVVLELRELPGGCEVTLEETPLTGLARVVDSPVLEAVLHVRNLWSLVRLGALARLDTTVGTG